MRFTEFEALGLSVAAMSRKVDGDWSTVENWPLITVHSALTPDGRVLTYGTNGDGKQTGYFIYGACDGTVGIDEIARRLAASYDVTLDTAQQHVRSTIAELNDGGLLLLPEDTPS